MPSLKEVLSPSRQNPVQRQGFFGSLAIAALVLLLHFPFEGYDMEHYAITRYGSGPCPAKVGLEQIKKMTSEEMNQFFDANRRCSDETELQLLPLVEWKSKAPIVAWFGSLVHAIAAIVFSLSLGGVWLWVFRTHNDG
jgi:hypothetical protein